MGIFFHRPRLHHLGHFVAKENQASTAASDAFAVFADLVDVFCVAAANHSAHRFQFRLLDACVVAGRGHFGGGAIAALQIDTRRQCGQHHQLVLLGAHRHGDFGFFGVGTRDVAHRNLRYGRHRVGHSVGVQTQ